MALDLVWLALQIIFSPPMIFSRDVGVFICQLSIFFCCKKILVEKIKPKFLWKGTWASSRKFPMHYIFHQAPVIIGKRRLIRWKVYNFYGNRGPRRRLLPMVDYDRCCAVVLFFKKKVSEPLKIHPSPLITRPAHDNHPALYMGESKSKSINHHNSPTEGAP